MGTEKQIKLLLLAAILLFVISFFLPACGEDDEYLLGWWCATYCIDLPHSDMRDGGWPVYFIAFNLSNLFMLVVPIMVIAMKPRIYPMWLEVIQVVLLVHVVSWIVICPIFLGEHFIMIGYWVWLASMIGALIGLHMKQNLAKPLSDSNVQ